MFTGLAETHLDVSDLDESIDFYETLGMDVAWRDEEVAFVWVEDPDGNRLEFLPQLSDG